MKRIFNNIMSVILAISIIMYTNLNYVNAQDRSTQLSKGQYIIINSKSNKLGYFKDGILVKEFSVATGKPSTPTPQGKFKIVNKIKDRPYYSGGIPGGSPNNPLGDRWLGLHVGITYGTTYAIHGNNDASSIGKHVSGGCIRMHNSEIRWLFDQINVGAYAIIDYSDKSFIEIAAKYNIKLQSENISQFKKVYDEICNYKTNINLLNKNDLITTLQDAQNILNLKSKYMNSYNKLTQSEKNNTEVISINTNFNHIMQFAEFAQAVIKFYDNISQNAENISKDINLSRKLNNHYTEIYKNEPGTRANALKEYNDIVGIENKQNSARVKYLDTLYNDSVIFLNICEDLYNNDIDASMNKLNQIQNENLKSSVNSIIKSKNDIYKHWAEQNIKKAMDDGWVDKANIFRPNDSITRAEFIKITNRVLGFNEVSDIDFIDVYEDKWYYEEIQKAKYAGYISGYEDNTFRPNDSITREEVANIITSIKNNKQENLDKIYNYADYEKIATWAKSSVEGAILNGYMGVSEKYFRPKDKITRAESVVVLQRVIGN